jgi:hypothetical protein
MSNPVLFAAFRGDGGILGGISHSAICAVYIARGRCREDGKWPRLDKVVLTLLPK